MSRTHLPLIALVGALALSACGEPADDTAATTTEAGAMNADAAGAEAGAEARTFLTDAMMGDNAEVRAGNLAAEKGTSEGVKDFGRMLASEHGAHKDKVAALAATMDMPATDATKPDADALHQQLQGLSGAEFDRAFAEGMVTGHEKTIAMYEAQANSAGDGPVKALAQETLPTLRKHLETAKGLADSM